MKLKFKAILVLLLSVLSTAGALNAQIYEPVKWSYKTYAVDEETFDLVFEAQIDAGWHVYSQWLESDEGPLPTWFQFDENTSVQFKDSVMECAPHIEYDPNFMMNLSYFEGKTYWRQQVKRLNAENDTIKGYLSFMVCDSTKCLPPADLDFVFTLSSAEAMPEGFEYCPAVEESHSETPSAEGEEEESDLWVLFLLGFGLGFAALLTPCVFPMIPMTVSFFTKQSKTRAQGMRNAFIYGFFIIFIYTGLGLLLTAVFGVDVLNTISTDPIFNIFLFALLVIFGISFLGAFEITLPSALANRADRASDKGGIMGIFFMAATLAIVSFSCTGPLVGTALAGAATGGYGGPASIMFGFSLALALPFMLFSAFPGWLNSLPSSGGWLNSVKVVLGLLEIGFAFKFLSNADLVWQAGLLKRELFIAIWVAVSALIAIYLFGGLRFPHDSKDQKMSVPRFLFGLVFAVLTIYMIPGLTGSKVNLISGFPPPMTYAENKPAHGAHVEAKYQDLDEAMEVAKLENKPVLIDFTGWACVNCRKMEETIWPVDEVAAILNDKVILVSLYVDDRNLLPEEEHRVETYGGKEFKIKTIGNKWTYLQASKYNVNAQPYYVMLDHNGNQLGGSASYDVDPNKFISFLKEGLRAFKK